MADWSRVLKVGTTYEEVVLSGNANGTYYGVTLIECDDGQRLATNVFTFDMGSSLLHVSGSDIAAVEEHKHA